MRIVRLLVLCTALPPIPYTSQLVIQIPPHILVEGRARLGARYLRHRTRTLLSVPRHVPSLPFYAASECHLHRAPPSSGSFAALPKLFTPFVPPARPRFQHQLAKLVPACRLQRLARLPPLVSRGEAHTNPVAPAGCCPEPTRNLVGFPGLCLTCAGCSNHIGRLQSLTLCSYQSLGTGL
ncbi:hypothetical protein FB451DRAFT_1559662 [Mycena latifolia]|nr:hypothetical protein FB451DRAFT_1559662 [Mycena latifolia]